MSISLMSENGLNTIPVIGGDCPITKNRTDKTTRYRNK